VRVPAYIVQGPHLAAQGDSKPALLKHGFTVSDDEATDGFYEAELPSEWSYQNGIYVRDSDRRRMAREGSIGGKPTITFL